MLGRGRARGTDESARGRLARLVRRRQRRCRKLLPAELITIEVHSKTFGTLQIQPGRVARLRRLRRKADAARHFRRRRSRPTATPQSSTHRTRWICRAADRRAPSAAWRPRCSCRRTGVDQHRLAAGAIEITQRRVAAQCQRGRGRLAQRSRMARVLGAIGLASVVRRESQSEVRFARTGPSRCLPMDIRPARAQGAKSSPEQTFS